MTFEVDVNGKPHAVSVERAGAAGLFRVIVNGTATVVDAQRFGDFGLSLLFPEGDHESGIVHLAPGTATGEWLATINGCTAAVALNGRRTSRGADAGNAAQGEQKLAAPMPGRVVRVLVSPGDEVAARQPVVVVEAMKMENELRSPKAGRVKDVPVAAGMSVDAGRVLIVIE